MGLKAKEYEDDSQSVLLDVSKTNDKNEYNHKHRKIANYKMTFRERIKQIFPTKFLFFFFITYTLLYIISAILVRFSSNNSHEHNASTNSTKITKSYSYDTVSVVLLTELLKLILNTFLYLLNGGNILNYLKSIYRHSNMAVYYLIPSGLYGLYNNLTFVSLSVMDPATYYILLQFRIAVTAFIYQILFQRSLSRVQWLSLVLLTLGCIIKQLPNSSASLSSANTFVSTSLPKLSFVIIAIQIFCSCFAGVYNEYLLKNKQENIAKVDLFIQNVYMYIDSIMVNLLAVSFRHIRDADTSKTSFYELIDLTIFSQPLVLTIILTSALCGLSTSYFIKAFNSIMKSYATSLELLLTAIICWFLFSIPITVQTILSICIVSYATYLFAKHPVISK